MKSIWKWILFGLAVFLLAFCIALPLFGGGSLLPVRAVYLHRMMPYGMMGVGSFGWIGLLARLAVPILFFVLVAAVVVLLLRKPSAPATPAATPCPSCGKPVQQGWVACPHCGTKL
jgi:hypothetical protein